MIFFAFITHVVLIGEKYKQKSITKNIYVFSISFIFFFFPTQIYIYIMSYIMKDSLILFYEQTFGGLGLVGGIIGGEHRCDKHTDGRLSLLEESLNERSACWPIMCIYIYI